MRIHRRDASRSGGAALVGATVLVLLAGCGSDDSPATTVATASTTTAAAAFPSAEFCRAQADLEAAQDGAQRNTAIAGMQAAAGEDAPDDVTEALDTLLTGDLDPAEYAEAEQTLAVACE